ncbi:MAG: RecQ family ATP-dependent DNA helicase [Ignavibacteria bacterium]|nr:RecQ family ATP-dependent DNA helicase [Ignavibacteria bacterium]
MTSLETLKKYFGYTSFRPGQSEIIDTIISGQNVLAVLPTGAGKSLCYQIPGLNQQGFSIVISPLIALMKDQVDALNRIEEIAAFINSSIEFYEIEKIIRDVEFGKIKLLYVAPERLENIKFADRIAKLKPNYLFVDEAHCISEWGHNFRPSYRKISEFSEYVGIKYIAAFTATATQEVVKDILLQLKMSDPKIFVRGFERDNLSLNVESVKHKNEKLLELLSRHKTPAIIYTASRRKAEEAAEYLLLNKISCAYYHAGMSSLERKLVQENFIADKIPIIVATNAFGMGIDKKDIRLVIHYNIPGSIENYYQEVGRAGRDGKESSTYLLFDNSDISIHQFFITNSYPDKELLPKVYDAICNYGQVAVGMNSNKEIAINHEYIAAFCGRQLTKSLLNASLKYLEQSGYLKILNELDRKFYVEFTVQPDNLKKYIKNLPDGIKRELLIYLLRVYGSQMFQSKRLINLSDIASSLSASEEELDELFSQFNNSGLINYEKPLQQDAVILTQPRIDTTRISFDYKRISDGYLNAQKKLDEMVQLAITEECRFKYILNYFGEETNSYKCGKCDNCLSIHRMSDSTVEYIQELVLRTLFEVEDGLPENNLLSILMGSSKSVNFKNFKTFGSCANYTKFEILRIVDHTISQKLIKREFERKKKFFLTNNGKNILAERGYIKEDKTESNNYEEDLNLLYLLKEERTKIAAKFSQPKYLICSDEVLKEIISKKPTTRNGLLSIKGFNERTFTKIGEQFLEIISNFNPKELFDEVEPVKTEKNIPQTIIETLTLINKGYSLKEICELRSLTEAVISMQVETILEMNKDLNISKLVSDDDIILIKNEMSKGFFDIKELKEKLPKTISYGMLRIALARLKGLN